MLQFLGIQLLNYKLKRFHIKSVYIELYVQKSENGEIHSIQVYCTVGNIISLYSKSYKNKYKKSFNSIRI